ncbi:glycoside hydrolase family 28 protein [Mucilaginibacter sp. FT3.2]|uniref:glycoside hydrolase family 28 protein n=1 Tax=Mucilaginibacter sp. FT3.2 TaxID=2723090 RepID=UPI0016118875|nr:glycosyl hydrolase family 28 protein [Mucilaginibacter sp. FT3.2]MBB6232780.1 polygalacturonase [Mucilaginibacter sp. FT3.2]
MKSKSLFFLPICFLLICCTKKADSTLANLSPRTYFITSYGAATSLPDNAVAVQKAIDSCSSAGGGTVEVPAGTFLCGPVLMKSNINFQLDNGSVLKVLPYGTDPAATPSTIVPFIDCNGINNFSITGTGTIEGQGGDWWTAFHGNKSVIRPVMIPLIGSRNAKIMGITIQNAPNVHIGVGRKCNMVNISGVTINSPSNSPNTDGIDTWSPNVSITNCHISCGDDNIAVDSYSAYINIKGCTFGTGHGCSIGSYTTDVHDINVDSCIFNSTTTGVRIKSNRGRSGIVQNITYSNITMTNVANAINITCYYPKTPLSPTADSAQATTALTPDYKNIILKNITAIGTNKAGVMWGLPEQPIQNIVFDNVKITAATGLKAYFVSGAIFKNSSQITVSTGDALNTYYASVLGINLVTGQPQ